jgi:hypothetical protein
MCCSSFADQPTCHPHSGGAYCQYSGKVDRLYVNAGNLILLYFDTPLVKADAESNGINVSSIDAAAININDNPEFSNLFYSTALAAQASDKKIIIQMRGTQSGYLKADRIWIMK